MENQPTTEPNYGKYVVIVLAIIVLVLAFYGVTRGKPSSDYKIALENRPTLVKAVETATKVQLQANLNLCKADRLLLLESLKADANGTKKLNEDERKRQELKLATTECVDFR